MAPFIKALRVVYCTLFLSHDQMSCDPFAAILLLRFFCCDYLSGYPYNVLLIMYWKQEEFP